MSDCYFQGHKGYFFINNPLKPETIWSISDWTYELNKDLVDITNSLSFGKDQFIGNMQGGNINAKGYLTQVLFEDVLNELQQGQEILVNLYFDYEDLIGFEELPAVLESIKYTTTVKGAVEFEIAARISEPRI